MLDTPIGFVIGQRLKASDVHAPHLIDLEIAQALRRLVFQGALSRDRSEAALANLLTIPFLRYLHWPLLGWIWELRATTTDYAASYVALAETLDAPLLTRDARMARASGHRASIELV